MKRNPYLATAGVIYLYFVVYGMAVIVMSQNQTHLQAQWGATEGQVLQAIAGVGIGKIIGPSFAGFLSDRFGRRPVVLAGLVMIAVFLAALLVSPNWQVGFALALLFGLANAVGDTGNYPTLMEAFPAMAGTANVVVKAAIALGQLALPLVITAVAGAGLFWGLPQVALIVVLAVLFLAQLRVPYPDFRAVAAAQREELAAAAERDAEHGSVPRSRVGLDGAALVAYGFCATAMFWLAQNVLPKLGMHLAGMSESAGRELVSAYSIGSFAGVFVTATLVARWVKPVTILVVNPVMAGAAYAGFLASTSPGAFHVFAFVIGFFAAGGLFQLTVVVLAEFFPVRKGVVTSMVGLASGVAAFVLPYVSGMLVGDAADPVASYREVVGLGIGVAVAATILGVVVYVRYRHVVGSAYERAVAAPVTR